MQEIDTNRLVLRVACNGDGSKSDIEGAFFKSIDWDGCDGMGAAMFCGSVEEAMHFDSLESIWALVNHVSPAKPEVNGQPYRPLHTWSYLCHPISMVLQAERQNATLQ